MPRRVRLRREDIMDHVPGTGNDWNLLDDLGAAVIGLALVAVVFVLFLVLFPVVALAIEILLLIVLFIAGLFARIVLRRPWHVLARTGDAAYRWPVKGWRASGERVDQIADALASGSMPLGAELLRR